jgi:hypothetical protein
VQQKEDASCGVANLLQADSRASIRLPSDRFRLDPNFHGKNDSIRLAIHICTCRSPECAHIPRPPDKNNHSAWHRLIRTVALLIIREDQIVGRGPPGELSLTTVAEYFDKYDGKAYVGRYFSEEGNPPEKRWNKDGFLKR